MKISYDSEVDALYIRLLDGQHQCRTLRLSDEIALNIGEGELLVGIEVLERQARLLATVTCPMCFSKTYPIRRRDVQRFAWKTTT